MSAQYNDEITMEFARQDDCLDKMTPSDLRLVVGERDRLRDATALQAERVKELEADAARYQWLKRNVGEALTEDSLKNEFSEHKKRYVFPRLLSWADFCGPITLDEAIDYKIDAQQALSATAREEQS